MIIFISYVVVAIAIASPAFAGTKSAFQVIPAKQWKASHALIIGASDYRYWSNLEFVQKELNEVEKSLEEWGFEVTRISNPNAEALQKAFKSFIDQYGYDPDHRLLFFFSGHGHYRKDGEKGYLVPVDAPDPRLNMSGFLEKAVNMEQMMAWARTIESRHALFLIDACFSGTIFNAKSLPNDPFAITEDTYKPVRQFITAGSAQDKVPAKSIFTPSFLEAIIKGKGDLNKDGFVTGTELGAYLKGAIDPSEGPLPEYGKIHDFHLSRGDFVFKIPSASPPSTVVVLSTTTTTTLPPSPHPPQPPMVAEPPVPPAMPSPEPVVPSPQTEPPADRWTEDFTGMEFVRVDGGDFYMGCNDPAPVCNRDEQPVHKVFVDGFYIAKHEVTVEMWRKFVTETGYSGKGENKHSCRDVGIPTFLQEGNHPAVCISWNEAQAFARWLSEKTGQKFRLPTEAEWEYTARFSQKFKSASETWNLDSLAWHVLNSQNRTQPVGSKDPNVLGVHDMNGNVWEWCQDRYDGNAYKAHFGKNPCYTKKGLNETRVARGGGWQSDPTECRATIRYGINPEYRNGWAGFRLVKEP